MIVWIDQDCCTGAGLCVDRCPDLFVVLEDGIGYVHDGDSVLLEPNKRSLVVPARYEREAIDAAEHCPGECIYLEPDSPSQPDPDDPDDTDIVDIEIVVDSG